MAVQLQERDGRPRPVPIRVKAPVWLEGADEIARYANLSVITVLRARKSGALKCMRGPKGLQARQEWVDEWIDARCKE